MPRLWREDRFCLRCSQPDPGSRQAWPRGTLPPRRQRPIRPWTTSSRRFPMARRRTGHSTAAGTGMVLRPIIAGTIVAGAGFAAPSGTASAGASRAAIGSGSEPTRSRHSWKISSRLRFRAGSTTTTRRAAATASRLAETGRVRKLVASPRESDIARRRFSSIIGPRMKPSSSGAGSDWSRRPERRSTEGRDDSGRANECPLRVKILYCIGAAAIVLVRRLRHVQA